MRKIIFTVLIVIVFAFPSKVYADAAPPSQPPGTNPEPGSEITQVRMVSETVRIDISQNTPEKSLGMAKVIAVFNMRNLGNENESMAVRFPMGADDGYGTWVNIDDIVVKVDNQTIKTRIVGDDGSDFNFGIAGDSPWIVFNVDFPVQQDVVLQVGYTLKASGEMPFINFGYIFATGSGWNDTIRNATLIVNFPYSINELNLLPDQYGNEVISHQTGDKQLSWIYKDFEPTYRDNFEINLVAPSIWKAVLLEKSNLEKNPNDGEAWGRLGKLYKQIALSSRGKGFRTWRITEDQGARNLIQLSSEAYQHAVDLKLDDPLWHAGFADLLGYYAYWAYYEDIDTRPETYKALQEIQSAFKLAPNDPKVLEIADSLVYELNQGLVKNGDLYQFPGLTATPLFATAGILVPQTETPVPSLQPTKTQVTGLTEFPKTETPITLSTVEQPAKKKELPLCGSLVLVPIGLILWFTQHKKS